MLLLLFVLWRQVIILKLSFLDYVEYQGLCQSNVNHRLRHLRKPILRVGGFLTEGFDKSWKTTTALRSLFCQIATTDSVWFSKQTSEELKSCQKQD